MDETWDWLAFLFIRTYFCEYASNQTMSPVEAPIITSIWLGPLVNELMSWQSMWAFANSIFIIGCACRKCQYLQ